MAVIGALEQTCLGCGLVMHDLLHRTPSSGAHQLAAQVQRSNDVLTHLDLRMRQHQMQQPLTGIAVVTPTPAFGQRQLMEHQKRLERVVHGQRQQHIGKT
jgi:hypothetical protein